MTDIFVLDLETTGLDSYPTEIPVEIAIYQISEDLSVKHIYDTLIKHPKSKANQIDNCWWSGHSGIKYKDTKNSLGLNDVWANITHYLKNKNVTSWNTGYDLDKFIYPMMQDLGDFDFNRLSCPMIMATDHVKILGYYGYKWPRLEEASQYYKITLESDENFHRADFDTHLSAQIIVEMIKRGHYID